MHIIKPGNTQLSAIKAGWIEEIIIANSNAGPDIDYSLRRETVRFLQFSKTTLWTLLVNDCQLFKIWILIIHSH